MHFFSHMGWKLLDYICVIWICDDEICESELTESTFWSCCRQESKNELCLDLRSQDAANVANLLRLHLRQLANIPCNEIGTWPFEFLTSFDRNNLIYPILQLLIIWELLLVLTMALSRWDKEEGRCDVQNNRLTEF